MMSVKKDKYILLLFLVSFSGFMYSQSNINWFKIPAQTFNPYALINDTTHNIVYITKEFSISEQITFKEYKKYLEDMRKDSGQAFYKTQLPDSNMCLKEAYNKYISSKEFDDYPVLGISWENALNYCKWRTLKDNKDSLVFLYRLPYPSEWLIANDYLTEQKIKKDFNQNYSDWSLGSFDESAYDFEHVAKKSYNNFFYDYIYWPLKNDANVLKRELVMGNSFKYQNNFFIQRGYGYTFEGYAQIAFRIVKEIITPQMKAQTPILEKEYIKEQKKVVNIHRPNNILHYWGFYLK